jgi:hypothetical protein
LKDVADFIHANPGCSRRAVTDGVKGSKDAMGGRLQEMLKAGLIENRGSETNFILYVTDTGKAEFDLFDAIISQISGA